MKIWIAAGLVGLAAQAGHARPGIWTLGEAKRRFEAPQPLTPTLEALAGPWVLVAEVSLSMNEKEEFYKDKREWTKYRNGEFNLDTVHGQFEPRGLTQHGQSTFSSGKAFLNFTGVRDNVMAQGFNLWKGAGKSQIFTARLKDDSIAVYEGIPAGDYGYKFEKEDYTCHLDQKDSIICQQHRYYKSWNGKIERHSVIFHGFSRSGRSELETLTKSRAFRRQYREDIVWGKTNHFPWATGADIFEHKAGKTLRPTNAKLAGSWRLVSETSVENPEGKDRLEGLQDDLGDVIHLVFREEPTSVGIPTLLADIPNMEKADKDLICSLDPALVHFSRRIMGYNAKTACGLVTLDTLACETSTLHNSASYYESAKWEKKVLAYTVYIKEQDEAPRP